MRYEDWELPNINAFLKYYLSLRKVKFKIKYISYANSLLSMLLFANNIRSLKSVLYEIYAYTKIKLKSILKIY